MRKFIIAIAALAGLAAAGTVSAAGVDKSKIKHVDWHFGGIFGQFDKAAVLRGFQIWEENCSSCHSAEYFTFRNLGELGLTRDQVKAIASNYEVDAEPNEEGMIFDDDGNRLKRTAIASDYFPAPFPNALAAAAVHGKAPPDLSLMTKARIGGPDYLYTILTSYVDAEDMTEEQQKKAGDLYYNKLYGVIAMAAPLQEDGIEYVDGTKATVSQQAKDITEFLHWVAEPKLDQRKGLGVAVMIFMIAFTIFAFIAYWRLHQRVHHSTKPGPWPLH